MKGATSCKDANSGPAIWKQIQAVRSLPLLRPSKQPIIHNHKQIPDYHSKSIKMADQNGSATLKENVAQSGTISEGKGKGKGKAAVEPQTQDTMDVDDSSSEEEIDEVSHSSRFRVSWTPIDHFRRTTPLVSAACNPRSRIAFIDIFSVDEPDEDNMEEIDTGNIIQDGRRTRGRKIDFSKAAEELPEEDDDDDDDDFEAGEEDDEMKD
jgi:hypothetical protein